MTGSNLSDKIRGQRMLLTKWIKTYNSNDDSDEREKATRKLAEVLAWAASVGMSSAEIAEDRDLPHRAVELFETGDIEPSTEDSEPIEAERDVVSSVESTDVMHLGKGTGSVYVYGYRCAPDRLKIGRTESDVVSRIAAQINTSTPDRPILHLVLATHNSRALERALHGALALRARQVEGGGAEWFRTTVGEVVAIYRALVGDSAIGS